MARINIESIKTYRSRIFVIDKDAIVEVELVTSRVNPIVNPIAAPTKRSESVKATYDGVLKSKFSEMKKKTDLTRARDQ